MPPKISSKIRPNSNFLFSQCDFCGSQKRSTLWEWKIRRSIMDQEFTLYSFVLCSMCARILRNGLDEISEGSHDGDGLLRLRDASEVSPAHPPSDTEGDPECST